jgi:hypothetical protein
MLFTQGNEIIADFSDNVIEPSLVFFTNIGESETDSHWHTSIISFIFFKLLYDFFFQLLIVSIISGGVGAFDPVSIPHKLVW